ncbi:phosphatidylinositol-specific phospholipase C/glycerophosphodiester phosphodiesterase family protein [Aeoliella mucimassa]|uniref:Altered inheritance of mitochondria protein 6 n=1 Tax=Aeoliella mucimassa TaxID=2527972 RepID=A0A518AVQ4_9BACT|nr:phosphatidylinositol-specific phospholipase C/glycerophosphodiester phosphodiesterase family protein [Aeoliella mucimassa]QDU58781.1 hypothetical protein Pan181_50210 [Aeoliella mucimassa]
MVLLRFLCSVTLVLLLATSAVGEDPTPLPKAHAHNDYYHNPPLIDALDHGFCSVEADIFFLQGKLLVGHSLLELDERRTLEAAYLEPLKARVEANDGRVFKEGPPFMLLIDIKQDAAATYAELERVLANYRDMLSRWEDGEYHQGAIQIVISGDRPRREIKASNPRYVGIDGRVGDLDSSDAADLMPLISDRWGSHFEWNGKGEIPAAERDKLRRIVAQAHDKQRRVRFWATPETPEMWQQLLDADVDHINTDKLDKLQSFLLEADPQLPTEQPQPEQPSAGE